MQVRAVVPAEVLATLRELAERHLHLAMPSPYGRILHNAWVEAPAFFEAARDHIAPLAGACLGVNELIFFQDHFVAKTPRGEQGIQWHQDHSYWPIDQPRGLMAWVALDDADADNGCLHYVPRTHTLGECQPADFVQGAGQPRLVGLPPMDLEARVHEAVAVPVRAGDVLLHHPFTWHHSPPNRTDRVRRAWAMSWLEPGVRWAPEHAPHPFLHSLQPVAGGLIEGPLFPRVDCGPAPGAARSS